MALIKPIVMSLEYDQGFCKARYCLNNSAYINSGWGGDKGYNEGNQMEVQMYTCMRVDKVHVCVGTKVRVYVCVCEHCS